MKKYFIIKIALLTLAVIGLTSLGVYLFSNQKAPIVPTAGPITVTGKFVYLQNRGGGLQTAVAYRGFQAINGQSYEIRNRGDALEYSDELLELSGTFTPKESPQSTNHTISAYSLPDFDVVGTIDVTSIKKATNSK